MKSKRIKNLALAAVLAFGAVFACGGTPSKVSAAGVEDPTKVKVSSFETIDDLFKSAYGGRLGKVSINTDKAYVTDGNASARFEVWGDFAAGGTLPSVEIPLNAKEEDGVVDLSMIKSISFDIFNQSGTERQIGVALQADGVWTATNYATLTMGKNTVEIAYDAVGLSLACDTSKGQAIRILFDKPLDYEKAGEDVYYVDNVAVNKTLVPPSAIRVELNENELCSFDWYYQQFLPTTVGIGVGPVIGSEPILSINTDLKYCKDNTGKSLKVELPTPLAPLNDGWPGFSLIPAFFEAFDWTAMAEAGMKLAFDVYNTGAPFSMGIYTELKDNTLSPYLYPDQIETRKDISWAKSFLIPHGWTTFEFDIAEWNGVPTDERPVLQTDNLKNILFRYNKFAGDAKVFYFDNFRFVGGNQA